MDRVAMVGALTKQGGFLLLNFKHIFNVLIIFCSVALNYLFNKTANKSHIYCLGDSLIILIHYKHTNYS